MSRRLLFVLLLATGVALADEAPKTQHDGPAPTAQQGATAAEDQGDAGAAKDRPDAAAAGDQHDSPAAGAKVAKNGAGTQAAAKEDSKLGMSILGNQEAPKALVIVPWKRSELGASPGISTLLDDSRQPVDKDVFLRALSYYQVRSEKKP